jgi:hypothetical protein
MRRLTHGRIICIDPYTTKVCDECEWKIKKRICKKKNKRKGFETKTEEEARQLLMASSNFSRHDFFCVHFPVFVCFRLHSPLVMTAEKKETTIGSHCSSAMFIYITQPTPPHVLWPFRPAGGISSRSKKEPKFSYATD